MDIRTPTIVERLLGYMQLAVVYIVTAVMMLMPSQPQNFIFTVAEPLTTESEIIVIEYENETKRTVNASDDFDFTIEKNTGDAWENVPFADDFSRIETALVIMPTLSGKIKVNLNNAFGHTLEKGEYRFTFSYTIENKTQTAYAFFNVI